jgi:protein TonB
VVLEVLVSTQGQVSELLVSTSSGHRLLDEAALQAVKGWRFEPGQRGGVAMAMNILVPVRFDLR